MAFQMTSPESRVQRLWRLARIDGECVGALIEGYVPTVTAPDTTGFTAIVSMVQVGERLPRVEPDGRRVWVTPIPDEGPRATGGQRFDDLAEALTWLEAAKQELLEQGWREVGLDPLQDPD